MNDVPSIDSSDADLAARSACAEVIVVLSSNRLVPGPEVDLRFTSTPTLA
jgi:hypothetical protein